MPVDEELITGFVLELIDRGWLWLIEEWAMPTMLGLVDGWWFWLINAWMCGCIHALMKSIRQGGRDRVRRIRAKRDRKACKAQQRRLLARVRRLPEADQIRIMNWLNSRFEGEHRCN